jgi:succinate dehydrogenase/fumarate reductase flavoprotein subunit
MSEISVLEEEQVPFLRNPDGTYQRTVGFGQPGPWFLMIARGQTIKRKIARRVRAEGVNVFDYIMITKLVRDGNRIAGCVGYQVHTGEFYMFKAKTVVCCLGKTINRASANSSGNPFQHLARTIRHRGYFALTYEAGAKDHEHGLGPSRRP